MTNPEKPVLDEIDQLIAAGLDDDGVPLDDYRKDRYVKCELCQRDWHGLPRGSCPGAYGMKSRVSTSEVTAVGDVTRRILCVLVDGHILGGFMPAYHTDEEQATIYVQIMPDFDYQWNPIVAVDDSVIADLVQTVEMDGVAE